MFNRAWDLIEKQGRSADDDVEMLLCAAAARWHWGQAGGAERVATGDWQVGHVAALLGLGDLAQMFARRNLDAALRHEWDGWRLASAHEGMARALVVSGDGAGRDRHVGLARAALEREPDDQERAIIAGQLTSVPESAGGTDRP